MTTTRRLTGRIRVPLLPAEAFRLFTPRGEEDWAHGWHPRFPAPAAGHDSEVEVTYQLTALTSVADHELSQFAEHYPAYLQSWEDAITALLRNAGT